jgi:3',5'-nucleoside bisphosphate phosphatase
MRRLWLISAVALTSAVLGAQAPAVRNPLPVPDIPGYRTLKGDFHLHTVFSDGNVWPTVPVQEAWRDGLDVIALTEHAEYQPHSQDVGIDLLRSYQIAKHVADQLDIVLIPGMEITKPDPWKAPAILPEGSAHFNALFLTDPNAIRTPDLAEALRLARGQGAFVFWNHPRFRVPRGRWFPAIAKVYDEQLFQGMELVNGPDFYDEAFPWIEERKLTILANSDAHDPMPARATGVRRPITLLFVKSRDVEGVRDALINRRTAAWLEDDVWGAEEYLRPLWSAAVTVETPVVTRRPSPAIRLRNSSAIAMKIALREGPTWVVLPAATELPPESVTVLRPSGFAGAPPGESRIELRFEVLNLHIAPGRNLEITVPLTVRNDG